MLLIFREYALKSFRSAYTFANSVFLGGTKPNNYNISSISALAKYLPIFLYKMASRTQLLQEGATDIS